MVVALIWYFCEFSHKTLWLFGKKLKLLIFLKQTKAHHVQKNKYIGYLSLMAPGPQVKRETRII